ncbi:MAG: DUF6318 family protein [Sporichthyaceae bacterium]
MSAAMPWRVAVAAAVAALLLAGCGDSDDPFPEGQDVPTPITPVSAPPLAKLPDAATERTEPGSRAFARYYFESVVNYAYSTGDLTALVEYSDPECIVCRATVGDIASAYVRGKVDGGQVNVGSVEAAEATDELTNVSLKYSATRYTEVDETGRRLFSSPAKDEIELIVQLTWSESAESWRVREIANADLFDDPDDGPDPTVSGTSTPSPDPSDTASPTSTP